MRFISVLMLSLLSLPAWAQSPGMDIEAIVGEEAVSSYDVQSRMRFIIATAKLSDTPETIERIRPQVVRSLIDERLQLQEAKRKNITVADGEIGPAIATIEKGQGLPDGAIFKRLDEAGVPRETFAEQIRAQIAWSKLLSKSIRQRVKVGEDEIRIMHARVPESNKQEWQIAVLTLPVDKPQRDAEIKRLSDKLVKEVRAGANFEEVARQFSAGSVASFWVQPEQLNAMLAKALTGIKPGQISEPLRNEQGYVVVKLYGVRALAEQAPAPAKETAPLTDEERSRIANYIFQQKMELESQKYLRNLRRSTFIDIR